MTVQPRADGRYDVNDCLEDYDDWESYYEMHGNGDSVRGREFSVEWALELLPRLVAAIREGTP